MILADKIIELRKKSGLSQEELSDKIGVSRQAVSKWEGAQSIPDLDKILLMSELFGVSTDFLLKDELEFEDVNIEEGNLASSKRKVTIQMANEFIKIKFHTASHIAIGVSLCILSPITLIILDVLSEAYKLDENLMALIGLITLFLLVSIAVCLFIISGNKTKEYQFLEHEAFETSYGVSGMVKEKKKEFQDTYSRYNLIGVMLCVLSCIPLLVGIFSENILYLVVGLAITFFMVAIGCYMFVKVGCKMGSLVRLLQEGEYSKENKKRNPILDAFSSCYWALVTIIYLIWSFSNNSWEKTWIIWAVAGVLYGGLYMLIQVFVKKEK